MNFFTRFSISVFAALTLSASVFALPGAVGYAPGTKIMQGNQPFSPAAQVDLASPTNPYYLTITSPAQANYPQTVQISVASLDNSPIATGAGRPAGVDSATANGFVSTSFVGFTRSEVNEPMVIIPTDEGATFDAGTVTFTRGNQKAVVKVAVNVPLNPAGGLVDYVGDYWWQLTSVGWTSAGPNLGATINATILPPADSQELTIVPEITNLLPVQGTHYSYDPQTGPVSFPISFNVDVPQGGDALQSVTVKINGVPYGDWTAAGGQTTFSGSITSPNLTAAGDYTIEVTATNNDGSDTATSTITVDSVAPPPAVTIAYPAPNSDYNLFVPAPTVNVPVSFTAKVPDGSGTVIHNVTAKLDDAPYQPSFPATSHLDTSEVTGSVQLDLTTNGHYTLEITAYNEFGKSASATTDFWINRVENPVRQEIFAFENASFEVKVTGRSSYTYQWERQAGGSGPFVPLTNSAPYSGTDAATLLITGATHVLNGDNYRCSITGFNGGGFSSDPAPLIVKKLTPTITWNPTGFLYGAALSNSSHLNATATVAGTFAYSPAAGTVLHVGTRTLLATFSPGDAENYNEASASRDIDVTRAPLHVTANPATMVYGTTVLPGLSYNLQSSDFVNGDTAAVISGVAKLTTEVTSTTVPGNYTISIAQDTLTAADYAFIFANSMFVVTPAELTFTASGPSRSYGEANNLTFTTSGHVAGDTDATAFTGLPSFTTSAGPTSATGIYDVTIASGSLASSKYTFKFVDGTLKVTAAPLTVTANDASMTVGAALPTFSATITGFKNGETSNGVVRGAPSFSTLANSSSPAGTYTITPSAGTLAADNYAFTTFVDGTLTIGDASSTCGIAIINHAVVMNGQAGVIGSLHILQSEDMTMNGQASILGDLLLPGNPILHLNGHPMVGSEVVGTGPSTSTITLNGQAIISDRLVRNAGGVPMPAVNAPPTSTHDFTSSGKNEHVVLAPGDYRNVTINGKNTLVLQAGTYNIQKLTVTGNNDIQVTGIVFINVRDGVKCNGTIGTAGQPELVTLSISDGGLTLNGRASFHGFVIAPKGGVTLDGRDLLEGGIIADRLTINGQGLVDLCLQPQN